MPILRIRAIPDDLLAALKRRVQANHRSLQQELLVVLEEAAQRAPPVEESPPLRLVLSNTSAPSTWPREVIYGDEER